MPRNRIVKQKKYVMIEKLKQLHNKDIIFTSYIYAKNNLEKVFGDVIKGESLQKVLTHLENPKGDYKYMVENFTVLERNTISFISHKIIQIL